MFDLRSVLSLPAAYRLFVKIIGGNYRAVYQRDYVQAVAGQRILDLGCGSGDVLSHLSAVEYVGLDINLKYIRAARARFGTRGEFRCEDVAKTVVRESASFDIVMANGVLHHLADAEVGHLLRLARHALKPRGRLLTFDGCFLPQQSFLARSLLWLDRGRFVRTPAAYKALADQVFGQVRSYVRHNLLWLPYTHLIMVCTGVAEGQQRLTQAA